MSAVQLASVSHPCWQVKLIRTSNVDKYQVTSTMAIAQTWAKSITGPLIVPFDRHASEWPFDGWQTGGCQRGWKGYCGPDKWQSLNSNAHNYRIIVKFSGQSAKREMKFEGLTACGHLMSDRGIPGWKTECSHQKRDIVNPSWQPHWGWRLKFLTAHVTKRVTEEFQNKGLKFWRVTRNSRIKDCSFSSKRERLRQCGGGQERNEGDLCTGRDLATLKGNFGKESLRRVAQMEIGSFCSSLFTYVQYESCWQPWVVEDERNRVPSLVDLRRYTFDQNGLLAYRPTHTQTFTYIV